MESISLEPIPLPQEDPLDKTETPYVYEVKSRFCTSTGEMKSGICFIFFFILLLVPLILYCGNTKDLATYSSASFKISSYSAVPSSCEMQRKPTFCYEGYVNITYSNIHCMKLVTTSFLNDKTTFLQYLENTYPPNTKFDTYYKNNKCYFNLGISENISASMKGIITFSVFCGIALIWFIMAWYERKKNDEFRFR
jgi:hypothetical protein